MALRTVPNLSIPQRLIVRNSLLQHLAGGLGTSQPEGTSDVWLSFVCDVQGL